MSKIMSPEASEYYHKALLEEADFHYPKWHPKAVSERTYLNLLFAAVELARESGDEQMLFLLTSAVQELVYMKEVIKYESASR